ncbi:hypothetical protein EMMF5_005937 [Cystobasidiomycetes sp. EMM_F5]
MTPLGLVQPSLLALPDDVLVEIITHFRLEPDQRSTDLIHAFKSTLNKHRRATLCSIALVCRRVSRLATLYLYEHVVPLPPSSTLSASIWTANPALFQSFKRTRSIYLCVRDHFQIVHGEFILVSGSQSSTVVLTRLSQSLVHLTSLHLDLPGETTPGHLSIMGKELSAHYAHLSSLGVSLTLKLTSTNRQRREIGRALVTKFSIPCIHRLTVLNLDVHGVRFPTLSLAPSSYEAPYLQRLSTRAIVGDFGDSGDTGLTGFKEFIHAINAPNLTESDSAHGTMCVYSSQICSQIKTIYMRTSDWAEITPFTLAEKYPSLSRIIVDNNVDKPAPLQNKLEAKSLHPLRLESVVYKPHSLQGLILFLQAAVNKVATGASQGPLLGTCSELEIEMEDVLCEMEHDAGDFDTILGLKQTNLMGPDLGQKDWISSTAEIKSLLADTAFVNVQVNPSDIVGMLTSHWWKTFGSL